MQLTICGRCAFDATAYTSHDLATARRWLASMADEAVEGVDLEVLAAVPQVGTLQQLHLRIASLDPGRPDVEVVHDCLHLLEDLARQLRDAGAAVATQRGSVVQLSSSGGGVPKVAVDRVEVGFDGVVGDRQGNRKHHGRPFQALCLWSDDVIRALRDEGHPVHAGATGENVTVAGIDWASLRGGTRIRIGTVVAEMSGWCTPCRKIDAWFLGRSDRIHHDRHPGWSRAYAWVREPGTIRTGDEVVVEP